MMTEIIREQTASKKSTEIISEQELCWANKVEV